MPSPAFLRPFLYALGAWFFTSGTLLVFFYPVRHPTGPGWIGHLDLSFQVLRFVRIWRLEGRETVTWILALELVIPLILAFLPVLGASLSLCPLSRAI